MDDISGYTLSANSLIGDHFKHGDTCIVWPRVDYEDFPNTYRKEEAGDLLHTLKNVHYSLVSKLSDSYIKEYPDPAELLNHVLPLGLSEDLPTVQNMCVLLAKVMNSEMVHVLDKEENRSLLDLTVIVMQHWITQFIARDNFVLNNTLQIMEMLIKSWCFTSSFKHRPACEKLLQMSKEPMLPSSTKNQILRISSALVGSVSLDTVRGYTLASFDNSQADVGARSELNALHKRNIRSDPFYDGPKTA